MIYLNNFKNEIINLTNALKKWDVSNINSYVTKDIIYRALLKIIKEDE